ncbi:carbohydrate kinase [Bacillaceae bacterium SIJ1]|uniref:FGGY-family carbohydrate kinase n=1 Tax=Litoribacterium kuwaitense TaxID=1398745 RepID=UPI0013EA891A|nr:FGGY-family carbohydrate kinase [Litoribacterium kuwaitense]NGP46693.1 carbohydrate kinase [Litoribacterium kuwaitense]
MAVNYLLGIDIGTQSLKIGVYDQNGEVIAKASQSYPTYHTKKGISEQNPTDWWDALRAALQQASNHIDLTNICGITLCATSSTVVITDQNFQPIAPAQSWMDQRSVAEEEEINNNASSVVKNRLRYSGEKTSIEWMTTKALWLKRHYDLEDKHILEQQDWMNYKLTGQVVASKCNATCKWHYVESRNGFSEEFFEEVGLAHIVQHWPQRVVKVGAIVGHVTESAAKELGLTFDTPVFQGGIDAHIGMIGSNALEPGNLCMITGTSFVHLTHHKKPIFNNSLWGPYDAPLIDDHWLLEGGQLSAGSIISWFLHEFYSDRDNIKEVYRELDEEMKNIELGSDGLIVLDSWKGNRTPYKNPYATGAFIGLTLSHTKFHIYRAILESIAFGTKNVIETFRNSSIPIHKIIAGGGGTKNSYWMQMISDITGLPICIPEEEEIGTKGAAIIAAYGSGLYSNIQEAAARMVRMKTNYVPDINNTKAYEAIFQNYLDINELLFPIMKKLQLGEEEHYE